MTNDFMSTDSIYLRGMQFYGYHGVMPEETKLGQRYVVNLRLHVPLAMAGKSDKIQDTVNYAAVYEHVQEIVEGDSVHLIETLAERIAEDVLEAFPAIAGLDIEVVKPNAPIAGLFDAVSVSITRWRSGRHPLH